MKRSVGLSYRFFQLQIEKFQFKINWCRSATTTTNKINNISLYLLNIVKKQKWVSKTEKKKKKIEETNNLRKRIAKLSDHIHGWCLTHATQNSRLSDNKFISLAVHLLLRHTHIAQKLMNSLYAKPPWCIYYLRLNVCVKSLQTWVSTDYISIYIEYDFFSILFFFLAFRVHYNNLDIFFSESYAWRMITRTTATHLFLAFLAFHLNLMWMLNVEEEYLMCKIVCKQRKKKLKQVSHITDSLKCKYIRDDVNPNRMWTFACHLQMKMQQIMEKKLETLKQIKTTSYAIEWKFRYIRRTTT